MTLTVRLTVFPLTSSLRLDGLTLGFVDALVAAGAVAMPAILLVPPRRGSRAVDLLVFGFVLVAVMQALSTLLTVAFVVALRSDAPSTAIYTIYVLANPAVAITASVGAVLIAFGLARRIRVTQGPSNASVGCLAVGLWLFIAGTTFLEYLTAYSLSPVRGFGTTLLGLVSVSGWIGTAVYAARHRSQAPGSLVPLARGAGLIAISGVVWAVSVQILSSGPSADRSLVIGATRILDTLIAAVGWGLLLLAAIRGLPSPWRAAPEPPRPDAAATMNDP